MCGLDFIEELFKQISNKCIKDYGRNTWLIVRTASPIFGKDTFDHYTRIKPYTIPENKFEAMWVLFNSDNTAIQLK